MLEKEGVLIVAPVFVVWFLFHHVYHASYILIIEAELMEFPEGRFADFSGF